MKTKMYNPVYSAISEFYGTKKETQDTTTHRLLILPAGMLGVDAVIMSELLERDVNVGRKESITYRYVKNCSSYRKERAEILDILVNYFDHLKAADTDLVSIMYLGVLIRPSIATLRKAKEIPQHIVVTDIYNSHAYDDLEQSLGAEEDCPEGDKVNDYCVSYGDVPSKVLSKFISRYIKDMDRDIEFQFGIKRIARTTEVAYAEHAYAPLQDRNSTGINAKLWTDRSVDVQDLYGGEPLTKHLNPVLLHYMVYEYWHRIDPTDLSYQKYVLRFIMGITDDPEDVDIEKIIVMETKILRNTLQDMMSNVKVLNKPYKCTIGSKTLTFSPPAVVEYSGSLHHQRPYEGVVADFFMRRGFIEIDGNENVHPVELEWSRSLNATFDKVVLKDRDIVAPEDPNYQKVELLVMRDSETGALVVRCFTQKIPHVVMDAIYHALTETGRESIITAPHAPAKLMLAIKDFVYDPTLVENAEG